MNVTLARHAGLSATNREMHAFARLKGANGRDLYASGARGRTQLGAFARRNGDHQFVVVAAAQHVCPQR